MKVCNMKPDARWDYVRQFVGHYVGIEVNPGAPITVHGTITMLLDVAFATPVIVLREDDGLRGYRLTDIANIWVDTSDLAKGTEP